MNKMIFTHSKILTTFLLFLILSLTTSLTFIIHPPHQQSQPTFKDNLDAQNWYYGTITADDYRLRIFQITNTNTISTCPISSPYTTSTMNQCQSCSVTAPLRNLGTFLCQPCPAGQRYDINIGNCSTGIYATPAQPTTLPAYITTNPNVTTVVINQQEMPTPTPSVVAPIATPISTVSYDTNATSYPSQTTFPTTNVSNPSTNTTNTNTNTSINNNTNTTTTINPNTTISITTTTTTTIPTIPTPTPTPTNPNTNTNTNPTTTTTTTTNTSPSTTATPNTTSSSTNTSVNAAYNCPSKTPYFNTNTNGCQACSNTTQYVNITNQCLPIIYMTNLDKATNLIQPSINYTLNQNNALIAQHPTRVIQKCPESTPYLSILSGTGVCVGCNSTMYYAVATQTCISGCPKGTIYNKTLQLCVIGQYFTNPNTENLVSPTGVFDAWKQQIQTSKNSAINGQYCPQPTPYENNGLCVTCASNTPLFNVQNKQCINCGNGRSYASDSKSCVSSYSSSVSIQRMIANIL